VCEARPPTSGSHIRDLAENFVVLHVRGGEIDSRLPQRGTRRRSAELCLLLHVLHCIQAFDLRHKFSIPGTKCPCDPRLSSAQLRCHLVAGPRPPHDPSPVARAVQASPLCTAPSLQAATRSLQPFCASPLRGAPYLARLALPRRSPVPSCRRTTHPTLRPQSRRPCSASFSSLYSTVTSSGYPLSSTVLRVPTTACPIPRPLGLAQ
jgi:hypothetical protein